MQELAAEISGLDEQEQAELVALMWLGREDSGREEWDSPVDLAVERGEGPTNRYLLDPPLLPEYWPNGLERLGEGALASGAEKL